MSDSEAPKPTSSPDLPSDETLITPPDSGDGVPGLSFLDASSPRSSKGLTQAFRKALSGLSQYEIGEKLGEGGMGAVYRAKQVKLNRAVAIKVLPEHLATNPTYIARLEREAQILARINHPHVTGCIDMGEHDGLRYVVMEFVDGSPLSKLIKDRKRIEEREALVYTRQAALGLDRAYGEGIIHRDIKPENILMEKQDRAGTTVGMRLQYSVKIADLGLAAFANPLGDKKTQLTQEGSIMGTPHYMSPEQLLAARELDFRTDMYALGCTLYEMLTGETPYKGDTVGAVLALKINDQLPDPRTLVDKLSPQTVLLLQKMTARDRDDRYETYGALVEDIEAIENNRPMKAEFLAQSDACLALSDDTVQKLIQASRAWPKPVKAPKGAAQTVGSNRNVLLAGMGALVGLALVGALAVALKSSGTEPSDPSTGIKQASLGDKPADPPEKDTPPAYPVFPLTAMVEKDRTDDWQIEVGANFLEYAGDYGGLIFKDTPGKKRAAKALPAAQYDVKAELSIPVAADRCELQVGVCPKQYMALGLRSVLDGEKTRMSAYVESRGIESDEVIGPPHAIKMKLSPDDWHTLRAKVYADRVVCYLENEKLCEVPLKTTGPILPQLRLATENGGGYFRNILAVPLTGSPE